MITRIAHVGVATRSIAVTAEFYRLLGLELTAVEVVEDQKVKVAQIGAGDSSLELLEATDDDSPIARFIQKRGEGIHHICLEVDDLKQVLLVLKENRVRLIDDKPRVGAGGCLIAFVHPHSTGGVLIELTQAGSRQQDLGEVDEVG